MNFLLFLFHLCLPPCLRYRADLIFIHSLLIPDFDSKTKKQFKDLTAPFKINTTTFNQLREIHSHLAI